MQYLLELKGYKVETSKEMVINDNIIVELKAVNSADNKLRRQLWNDMNMAQKPYGMLINFGPNGLFSEWYQRYPETGKIEKVYLI